MNADLWNFIETHIDSTEENDYERIFSELSSGRVHEPASLMIWREMW